MLICFPYGNVAAPTSQFHRWCTSDDDLSEEAWADRDPTVDTMLVMPRCSVYSPSIKLPGNMSGAKCGNAFYKANLRARAPGQPKADEDALSQNVCTFRLAPPTGVDDHSLCPTSLSSLALQKQDSPPILSNTVGICDCPCGAPYKDDSQSYHFFVPRHCSLRRWDGASFCQLQIESCSFLDDGTLLSLALFFSSQA